MRTIYNLLATALLSLLALLAGCSSEPEPETSAAAKAAPTHPVTGEPLAADQTFTYWALDEHSSFDPQLVEDVSGSHHARNLFEGLLNQDADGNLVPGVAESYTTNADKTRYTFTLRDNAKWSNGDSVTANDFVYAWQRAADPELASPYAWFVELMNIKNGAAIIAGEMEPTSLGVAAIDDFTFEVELEASLPYFANMVTHSTTFPVHQATVEAYGEDWTKPETMVSNGAYKLTEHVVSERTEMVRNEQYWNNSATILDKLITVVVQDENQALIRWKADEFDWLESLPAGQFKALQSEFPTETLVAPRLCSYYYLINQAENTPNSALLDERVRLALAYAIDRDIITENITQGGQYPAYTFTPGATAGFTVPDVAFGQLTQAERDEQAKELLAAAGYADGLNIDLLYNTSEAHKSIATAIAQMWKTKLGVETTLNNLEWKTYLTARSEGDYEVARAGWCGDYNEASTFLDLVRSDSGYNDGKYANAEVDELMLEARTLSDPNPNYTRVEEIIAQEMAIIPIYHYTVNYMLKEDVKGWPLNNVEQNWYAKDLYKVAL